MLLALALAGNVAWNCNFFGHPVRRGALQLQMSRRGRLIGVGAGMEATHQIKFENFTLALSKRGEKGEGSRENRERLGRQRESGCRCVPFYRICWFSLPSSRLRWILARRNG